MNSSHVIMSAIAGKEVPQPLPDIVSEYMLKESYIYINGDSKRAFDTKKFPPLLESLHGELPSPYINHCEQELELVREQLVAAEVRNALFFSPNSRMPWHTNSDCPGMRTYFSYSIKGGAIFRYWDVDKQEAVDQVEPAGWVKRTFFIPEAPDKFWHTIYSPVPRWSFGFLMSVPHSRDTDEESIEQ